MRSIGARDRNPAKFAAALQYLTKHRWGEITLTPDAATTTLRDPSLNPKSLIYLDPLTASAAAALVSTFVTPTDRGFGVFIITHTSDAATDRSFRWSVVGE